MIRSLQTLAAICFLGRVVLNREQDKREPGLLREDFRCSEMFCICSKTYCSYYFLSKKFKCSSKGLNKRTFDHSGDGPIAKYRNVLDKTENATSANRGFLTKNHCVATYKQTKKGLSYFYLKRLFQPEGILLFA